MNGGGEDPRLLNIAEAISDGTPVDWEEEEHKTGPLEAPVLEELRALERVALMASTIPPMWGPLAIKGEIGRGAFGVVYRAADRNLGIDVALKVIRPTSGGAPIDPERALHEARLLAKINHPNVVRVFHAERIDDEVGVSMELVEGLTLDQLVERDGPLSAKDARLIGMDLCQALAAVHGAESLHGDVKAHNVMRTTSGRTVLMDFGTGKDLSVARDTAGNDFAGTPIYLAPEVFLGAPRTKASDIYGLGVLLYYLVTGRYPVEGDTRTEIGLKHRAHARPTPLREARPGLPDAFVRVVEKALAEVPSQRHHSAAEFEAALDDAGSRGMWSRALAAAGVAAVIGLAVLAAADWRPAKPSATMLAGVSPPAAAPASPAYQVDAALYRYVGSGGTEVPVGPDTRLSPKDRLSLRVQTSVPAYVYLVNEDERGESYLLYPLPGQGLTNPLPAGIRHRLPGSVSGQDLSWEVTTAGQQEHFLLFVSPQPAPEFDEMFERLPRPALNRRPAPVKLSPSNLEVLRGVGGLAPVPRAASAGPVDLQLRKVPEFSTPLSNAEETAHGVWVRRLTVANPAP